MFARKKLKTRNMLAKPLLTIYSLLLVLCLALVSSSLQQEPIHWYPCPFFTNFRTKLSNTTDSVLHAQEIEETLLELVKRQENEKLEHISQQIFGTESISNFEIPRLTKRNIDTMLKGLFLIFCFICD